MDKPLNQDSYAPILASALAPTPKPKPKPKNAPLKISKCHPRLQAKTREQTELRAEPLQKTMNQHNCGRQDK
jgi:hypothetical protein